MYPVSCLLSPVSCLLSPVSCLLSPVSCFLHRHILSLGGYVRACVISASPATFPLWPSPFTSLSYLPLPHATLLRRFADSVVCPADVVNPPSETGEYTVGRIVGLVIAGVAAVMLVTMVLGYRKDGQRNTGYVTINN